MFRVIYNIKMFVINILHLKQVPTFYIKRYRVAHHKV